MSEHRTKPEQSSALRWARILIRSLHLVALAGLAGGVFWGAEASELAPWWTATAFSGAALAATFSTGGLGWIVELRGLSLILKLGLLALIFPFPDAAPAIFVSVILLAGITSHMPGRYRYWVPWQRP